MTEMTKRAIYEAALATAAEAARRQDEAADAWHARGDEDGGASLAALQAAGAVCVEADAALERAREDYVESDEPRIYMITSRETGRSETFDGALAEAHARAMAWAIEADYGKPEQTVWGDIDIIDSLTGSVVETFTVAVDPDAPDCAEGHEHDWQDPSETNGTVVAVCAHCGTERILVQRPGTGTSVSYDVSMCAFREVGRALEEDHLAADRFILDWDRMPQGAVLIDTTSGTEIVADCCETPEDATLGRNFAPLVAILNEQDAELAELRDALLAWHHEGKPAWGPKFNALADLADRLAATTTTIAKD